MKKIAALSCAVLILTSIAPKMSHARIQREPGGFPAFLVGCCLGLREGTQWNEGSVIHWREWTTLLPGVGVVFMIWNGAECARGVRAHEWATDNGANWY